MGVRFVCMPEFGKPIVHIPITCPWTYCRDFRKCSSRIWKSIGMSHLLRVTAGAAMMLAELAMEAGLPKGVLNIVHGTHVWYTSSLTLQFWAAPRIYNLFFIFPTSHILILYGGWCLIFSTFSFPKRNFITLNCILVLSVMILLATTGHC